MTMPTWTAGHLPGLDAREVAWHTLPFAAGGERLEVRVPVLQPAQLRALARSVKAAAAQHLKPLPVSRIVQIVDAAVARLLDPADPFRREAEQLLPVVSGYDAEMVRLGLNGFLQTFRAPQLHRFVAEDFTNPKVLDEFQPAVKGGSVRAFAEGERVPRHLVLGEAGQVAGGPGRAHGRLARRNSSTASEQPLACAPSARPSSRKPPSAATPTSSVRMLVTELKFARSQCTSTPRSPRATSRPLSGSTRRERIQCGPDFTEGTRALPSS